MLDLVEQRCHCYGKTLKKVFHFFAISLTKNFFSLQNEITPFLPIDLADEVSIAYQLTYVTNS